jgi:hypothetical protein
LTAEAEDEPAPGRSLYGVLRERSHFNAVLCGGGVLPAMMLLDRAREGRIFVQRSVCSYFIVISRKGF